MGCDLVETADGDADAELGAQVVEQLDEFDGGAADLEEVVLQADLFEAEQGLPVPGHADLVERHGLLVAPFTGLGPGCGQGGGVDLAVGGERQGGQFDEVRRDHVRGERPGQVAAQGPAVECGAGCRYAVGAEHGLSPGVRGDGDDGAGERGPLGEVGLDLADLDAVAAQFDLAVGAAEQMDAAVGVPAGDVAGPVEPFGPGAGPFAERTGDEAVRRLFGLSGVSEGDAVAADPQFAGDSGRDGFRRGCPGCAGAVGRGRPMGTMRPGSRSSTGPSKQALSMVASVRPRS